MAGRNHLYVPGPTNSPDSILNAMHLPMEDHRSSVFPELVKPLLADLKKIFQTETGQAFIFPATGTAGWEIAMNNTLSPGDKLLSYRFGQFSHLWIDLATRLGFEVQYENVAWGDAFPLDRLKTALEADSDHSIKGIMACHNETATGVASDIAGIRRVMDEAGHPALLYVDGVSAIASLDFQMDEWGVDVIVTGSQKGFMMPAGGAFLAFSQKALEARKSAKCPRAFFDIEDHIVQNRDGYFPYTPSTPILHGLRQSIDLLLEEGLENVFSRHYRLAEGVRRAIDAWGLKLCANDPATASNSVTAIMVPEGFDAKEVIAIAFNRYNISLGAGLTEVAGKLFRIGHMGDNNDVSLLGVIAGVEMAMLDSGIPITPGSGVTAALEYYRSTAC